MLCFRCGSPVSDNAAVCDSCGQDLSNSALTEVDKNQKRQRRETGRHWVRQASYQVGDLLQERYEVLGVIGSGPLGLIYRAFDREVEVEVALKVIAEEFLPDEPTQQRFLQVLRKARGLVHDNVVRYFDVDRDNGRCFYVMQLLEGLTLRKIINLRRDKEQRFTINEIEPIYVQLCNALARTSRQLIHGGVKPENIIILPDLLKLTDFGLYDALPRSYYLSAQQAASDSTRYLAPELLADEPCTPAADVYSVAVLILELLTGRPSEGGEVSVPSLSGEVPEAFERVLRKALARNPEHRYEEAGELGDDLTAGLTGRPVHSTLPYSYKKESDTAVTAKPAEDSDERLTQPVAEPEPEPAPSPAPAPNIAVTTAPAAADDEATRSTQPVAQVKEETVEGARGEANAEEKTSLYRPADGGRHQVEAGGVAAQGASSAEPEKSGEKKEVTNKLELADIEFASQQLEAEDLLELEEKPDAPQDAAEELSPVLAAAEDRTIRMSMEEVFGDDEEDAEEEEEEEELLEVAPAAEGTQQIEADMIVQAGESLEVATASSQVETSGELFVEPSNPVANAEDSVEDTARRSLEKLESKNDQYQREQEARARGVLQAFDLDAPAEAEREVSEERYSAGAGDEDEALGDELDEGQIEPAAPAVAPTPSRVTPLSRSDRLQVAPEVLNQDAVPSPIDVTVAVARPAPTVQEKSRLIPLVVLGVVLLLVGGTVGLIYSITQSRSEDARRELERKQQLASQLISKPDSAAPQEDKPLSSAGVPEPKVEGLEKPQPQAGSQGLDDLQPAGQGQQPSAAAVKPAAKLGAAAPVRPPAPPAQPVTPSAPDEAAPPRAAAVKPNKPARTGDRAAKLAAAPAKPARSSKPAGGQSAHQCPAGMAHIPGKDGGEGYCIDRFEYPGRGKRPLVGVSLDQARGLCRSRGLRLCSAKEWLRSCASLFPYGRTYNPERCNTGGESLVPAGARKGCRSRHGIFDLSGNASEWVEEGTAMGGDVRASEGHASCPSRAQAGPLTGFRCCGDLLWE